VSSNVVCGLFSCVLSGVDQPFVVIVTEYEENVILVVISSLCCVLALLTSMEAERNIGAHKVIVCISATLANTSLLLFLINWVQGAMIVGEIVCFVGKSVGFFSW